MLVKLRGAGGSVGCDFAFAAQLTLVRVSATPMRSDDHRGAPLVGQVGRGV